MLTKMAIMALLGLSAIGLGAPLMRLLAPGIASIAGFRLGLTGLLGLLVAATIATLVNFLMPVTPVVAGILFAIGLMICIAFARGAGRTSWLSYFVLVVVILPLSVFLSEGQDGGLYHLPHQLWITTDKVVFGLANLHFRFGFNSLNEPLLALGWLAGGDLSVAQLMAGLFGLLFLTAMAEAIVQDGDEPVQCYFASLLTVAYAWLHGIVTYRNGWTNTDTPAMIVLMIAVYCAVNAAVHSNSDFLVLSFFFAVFACALKLSAAPVLLVPLGLAVALVIRGQAAAIPIGRIVLVCALFAPWMARNVVVSGCLVYPAAASCLPVPWAAVGNAAGIAAAIKDWALGFRSAPDSNPFLVWARDAFSMLITWPIFVALGVAIAITIRRRHPVVPTTSGLFITLAVYAIAGTIWWLLMAPDPRFGFGHLAVLGTLPGLMLLLSPARVQETQELRWLPASLLVGSLAIALGYSVIRWSVKVGIEGMTIAGYQPVTVPEIETVMDGDVRRPVTGDNRCFLTPPPCSPYGASSQSKFGPYIAYFTR